MFENFNFNDFIIKAALLSVPFLFAVTIHEVMHGYVAYRLGDSTAKNAGRLTLNPIAHLDPLGLIVLLVTNMIGWAKPVPVNYYHLRHKYGVAMVSVAGPLANLVTAFLSACILKVLTITTITNSISQSIFQPIYLMTLYSIMINIALFVFNLLPIMPMDGARIIWNFLPPDKAAKYEATTKYYFLIILVLIFTNALHYIISPIRHLVLMIFSVVLQINI